MVISDCLVPMLKCSINWMPIWQSCCHLPRIENSSPANNPVSQPRYGRPQAAVFFQGWKASASILMIECPNKNNIARSSLERFQLCAGPQEEQG